MTLTKSLTDKEKLFCTYVRLGHCGREAAAKSGYRTPERAAMRLLLNSEEADPADPETLDLFSVAELKRPKGGGLEIKFFDRLKALEHMEQLSSRAPNESAAAFYAALGGAAQQTEPAEGESDAF